jgi:hypothetical protein
MISSIEPEGFLERTNHVASFVINNHLSGFAPQSARLASRLLGVEEPDLEAARVPEPPKGQRRLLEF